MRRIAFVSWVVAVLSLLGCATAVVASEEQPQQGAEKHFRRPVALAFVDGHLFAANRSGSISIIDAATASVTGELPAGGRLADVIVLPDGKSLLTADQSAGTLVRLRWDGRVLSVAERCRVGFSPVSAVVSGDGALCAVADLWAHRVSLVDVGASLRLTRVIDLPFAPRLQWMRPDGRLLVVADAFGGEIALIDPARGRVTSVRSMQAHNIRGMAASPDGRELVLSHPMLEEGLPTTHSNVFWGSVIGSVVREVSFEHLLASGRADVATPIAHWSLFPLGEPGRGAGDPAQLVITRNGTAAVSLSGVDEIAVGRLTDGSFRRVAVGRGPTALCLAPDGRQVYVANTFDDSISVVDLSAPRVLKTIPLDPLPRSTDAERGEALFHDARLSLDGWYSCQSCHTDGHTTGLLNDNLSDHSLGTPKRILSLLGVKDTGPWAWNGGIERLEDQVHNSILNTMHGKPEQASGENVRALTAYLRTLTPPPSLSVARGTLDTAAVARGQRAFDRLECARCHKPPTYTSASVYDVGVYDEVGLKRFNPPSLLGVSQRPAFFHDNRARTLRDVFTRFRHADEDVPAEQIDDLIAFLESL